MPPEIRDRIEGATGGATGAVGGVVNTAGGAVKGVADTAGDTLRRHLSFSRLSSLQLQLVPSQARHRTGLRLKSGYQG